MLAAIITSCASAPIKTDFGLVGFFEYKNARIRVERVRVPFHDGDSTLVLEGMLYRDPQLLSYRGIVMTHGRDGPRPGRKVNQVFGSWKLNLAMAESGAAVLFIVRRGYGASEGKDSEFLETPAESGLAAAQDLAAGVDYLKSVEGVNETGIIVMGHSQGGWAAIAAASLDLTGVVATVNLCGGTNYRRNSIGWVTEQVQRDYAEGCSELGATARIPSIWIYSENDRNHAPKYVRAMHDAYTGAGGRATLHILPAYKDNGHLIVEEPDLFLPLIIEDIKKIEDAELVPSNADKEQ
jgi:pimeloyl-ACP methyl ester carboxylesterase